MNLTKKLTALALAAAMTLGLVGCGGASSSSAVSSDAASTSAADSTPASDSTAAESDVEYIKDKGTLVVGITDFAPMDYKDDAGEWIGFDADLAKLVAEDLGVDVEFIEIEWSNKILELENKSVDVIWNGMTLNDETRNGMEVTAPYCHNSQVVVVPADKADQYQDVESLASLLFVVEAGSAGEDMAEENGFEYNSVESQAAALMEVAAGTSDACIIDLLMAGAMIGEGTDYPDLTNTVSLSDEEYGIGCRKGSDLAAYIDGVLDGLYADGTMEEIATTYGVQMALAER